MDVKSMLLGFLMKGSMTGYELKKIFQLSFSFFSAISYGSVYPALKKMKQEGLVTMIVEVQDGAPNKKVYTITEAGKSAFLGALRAPMVLERVKSTFLTRLFFFSHLNPNERVEAANGFLASVQSVKDELAASEPVIKAHADRYQYLCYQFGTNMFESMIHHIKSVIGELEEDKKRTGLNHGKAIST